MMTSTTCKMAMMADGSQWCELAYGESIKRFGAVIDVPFELPKRFTDRYRHTKDYLFEQVTRNEFGFCYRATRPDGSNIEYWTFANRFDPIYGFLTFPILSVDLGESLWIFNTLEDALKKLRAL